MAYQYASPEWLKDAVFYEIYPQTFQDTNGDGIGDIQGIIDRLDYIKDLGANALWLNPLFDSPFKDAGYDVRNYELVAPRYGTNDDLIALFEAAHDLGMHVFLDLVPGHTSEEHEWFLESAKPERGRYSDRYVWTDSWIAGADGYPFIGGESERDGTYVLNFFKSQPALNYGWAHPKYPWQHEALGPQARDTADAMAHVIRFWLERGADGFRVDMANSLVKHDDGGKPFTIETWRYIFAQVRPDFPQAAFVAEWGVPYESMQSGFDMDFYLDWRWGGVPNGYNYLLRNTDTPLVHEGDASYFNVDSGTSIQTFVDQYVPQLRDAEKVGGYFSLITSNHDTQRVAQRLTQREIELAYATLFTLPGVPFIYYGDEIGMRYLPIPTKEGGYVRTGTRTPMQWDSGPNAGFSTASAADLYLPIDHEPGSPTVAEQSERSDSLLARVKEILALKHKLPALRADASFDVLRSDPDGRLFAFTRGAGDEALTVAVNPGRESVTLDVSPNSAVVFGIGEAEVEGEQLKLGPQSFALLRS